MDKNKIWFYILIAVVILAIVLMIVIFMNTGNDMSGDAKRFYVGSLSFN